LLSYLSQAAYPVYIIHMFVFQEYYKLPLGYYPHMGHLWFLGNIFVYVLLLLPLFFYLKKNQGGRLQHALSSLMRHPGGPLLLSLLFVIEAIVVKPQLYSLYAQTWHGFFLGLLAFFLGFLFVYSGKEFWQTMLKWKWGYLGLAALLYSVRYVVFATEAPGYLTAIESNCWIFGVFGLGYTYLNRPSALLSYLSQAAYPVYIIHMFVLYAGGLLILPLDIPILLKFVGVVAFTGVVCFLIYEYILRRVVFLRPLFGLKWRHKKYPALKMEEITKNSN
ncbi:MAG: acyltransferase family protein, partial [Arenibacter sp.]|nr:acyltransferase family protein [Arenibacter sp.]